MPKFVIERDLPGAGSLNTQELECYLAEIVRCPHEHGPADSVGSQLRYPGQDLLYLHRAGRENGPRACHPGRFSR